MESILKMNVLNSDLAIPKEKRIFLSYYAEGLMPCTLEELEDGIELTFNVDGRDATRLLLERPMEDQLRFLANCADLEKPYAEYFFSLEQNNIVFDINLRPYILLRDIRTQDDIDFLTNYRALICSMLFSQYTYDDFLYSGQTLSAKNEATKKFFELESVQEIKAYLLEQYWEILRDKQECECSVPKKSVLFLRIAVPILAVALIIVSFLAIRALLVDIPYRNQVILANEAYIAGDHLAVQEALSEFPLARLSNETRYILARSYIVTEPLSDVQKEHILMGLTLITDPIIFDYWIFMGRLQFDEAIDIARRFGDNELRLFAYLKYEAYIIASPHIPGEEKVTRLSQLENQITQLQRLRDEAAENMTEEDEDDYEYGEYQNGYYDSYQDGYYYEEQGGY